MKKNFFLVLAGIIFLASCKQNPPISPIGEFNLQITPTISGLPFVKNEIYQNVNNRSYQLENLGFYVSDIILFKSDGDTVRLKTEENDSEVVLFNLTDTKPAASSDGKGVVQHFQVETGTYSGISFMLGVPESLNHGDPTDYPTTHPLSEFSGMHWTWNSGYIFLKIDGFIDSTTVGPGSQLDHSLTYHIGLDTLARTQYFNGETFTIEADQALDYELELDINKLFYSATDTLNMVERHLTHTNNDFDLAEEVINNFTNAWTKRPF